MNKDDINKIFNKIQPSEEDKEKIYNEIIKRDQKEKAQANSKVKSRRSNKRFKTALVLSLLLVFGITVYAVSNTPESFSSKIKNFSLSQDAKSINISSSDKGYKITAESVFGDEKFAYILFSIERENGKNLRNITTLLSGPFWANSSQQSIKKNNSEYLISSFNSYALDSEINTEKKEYFLQAYNIITGKENENNLIGSILHLQIDRISLGFLEFGRKGSWEFNIPLEYKDISKIYEVDKEFKYKDGKIKLDKMHFSDLDAVIYLKSNDKLLQEFSEEYYYIDFKMKDGRKIEAEWNTGGGDLKGSHYYYSISLVENGRINPKDISEIHFEDIVVEVDLEE